MTSISDKYKSFSDNLATDLFKAVVERYGIPFDELWELYSKEKSKNLQNIEPQEIETKEIEVSTTDILSMKVAELKALCKTRGLKVSGKKNDLLERLLGRKVDDKEVPKKKSKSFTAKEKDVVKKVKPPSLKISKNSNGDYMHNDSKLVFNQETKKVFAKYIEGEGNQPLTKEDIELCNKFRFAYEMPDNLNVKRTKAEEVRLENLLADEEEEVNQARLKRGVRMREGDVEENETEKDIEKMVGEALKGNLDEEVVEEEVDDEEEYEEVVDDDEEVVEENPKKEDGEEEVEEEDDEEEVEYEEVEEEDDEEEYEEVVDDDEVVEENPKEEVEYEEEDDEEEYEEVVDDDEVVEENPKEEVEYEEVEYEEVEEDEEVEYEEVVDDDVAEEDGEEEVEYEEVEEDEEVEYEEVEVVLDSDGNEIEYESEAENIDDILNDSDFGSENDDDEEEYE